MPGALTGKGGEGGSAAEQANIFAEKSIAELRRQFDLTQENILPFVAAGTGALPDVVQGITAGGLDERLAEIFGTGAFESLIGERTRAVEGQLAAGGLTRSGTAIQEAANIPTSLGLALEELLTGRATNLAASGQNAALGLGQLGAQTSGGIANLFAQQGQNLASGILTDAQARAGGISNLFSAATLGLTAGNVGGFSDPVLKENIEAISKVGDLAIYQWDWVPETKGTMIEKCGTMGFMADEVKEKYPHHVDDFCGFMVIDYPALLDELETSCRR